MKPLAACACLVAVVLTAACRADEPQVKPIKVPFQLLKSQHIVVEVKVNGAGPYRLIFDTGAPVLLVNNKVARAAGILPRDFKKPASTLFGSAGQFQMRVLEVGGVKAVDLPVLVMDHPTVAAISKAVGPIDGIVGFPFFARYRMTLDYQARELTFVPVHYRPPDVLQQLMKTLTAVKEKAPKQVLAPAGQWGFRVAKGAQDTEPGVTVEDVLSGSPAAQAGLKAGDRLLTLAGRWTDSVNDCYAAAGHVLPGMAGRLVVRRDGKEVELTVRVQPGL